MLQLEPRYVLLLPPTDLAWNSRIPRRGKLGSEVLGDFKPVGEENATEKLEIIAVSDVLVRGIVSENGNYLIWYSSIHSTVEAHFACPSCSVCNWRKRRPNWEPALLPQRALLKLNWIKYRFQFYVYLFKMKKCNSVENTYFCMGVLATYTDGFDIVVIQYKMKTVYLSTRFSYPHHALSFSFCRPRQCLRHWPCEQAQCLWRQHSSLHNTVRPVVSKFYYSERIYFSLEQMAGDEDPIIFTEDTQGATIFTSHWALSLVSLYFLFILDVSLNCNQKKTKNKQNKQNKNYSCARWACLALAADEVQS